MSAVGFTHLPSRRPPGWRYTHTLTEPKATGLDTHTYRSEGHRVGDGLGNFFGHILLFSYVVHHVMNLEKRQKMTKMAEQLFTSGLKNSDMSFKIGYKLISN